MIHNIRNYIRAYKKYTFTMRELQNLTDRELLDIGVHRCDIATLAQQAFEKEINENKISFMQLAWSR